ncbi:MAG: hypothetical protein ACK5K7_01105 [Bacilli bacterium]
MENIIFTDSYINELEKNKVSLVLIDKNVYLNNHLKSNTFENVEVIDIDETTKNYTKYLEIIDILDNYLIKRNDAVVIIGGGVLLDVATFACSTYKRGVNHINVPTTLLAMVDASVGGKCGINYNNQKNIIGTFAQAKSVIIDIKFLATLSKRNLNSAMSEVIKMALLNDQNNLFKELLAGNIALVEVIKKANEIKSYYVDEDINDLKVRRFLNLGHTYAHAIESYYQFERYNHGEAVALGLVIATNYDREVIKLLQRYDLDVFLDENINIKQLVDLMMSDKKNTNNLITHIDLERRYEPVVKEISKMDMINKIKIPWLIKINEVKEVKVNNSKSLLHRQLMLSLLEKSEYQIELDKESDLSHDIMATINVLKDFNIDCQITDNRAIINSTKIEDLNRIINFQSSGTTLRVMLPILLKLFKKVKFTMSEQLCTRPIDELEKHFLITKEDNYFIANYKDVKDVICVDGSISSQYISGFIYMSVLLKKDMTIKVINEPASINYILMTIDVLRTIGENIEFNMEYKIIVIKKCEKLKISSEVFKSQPEYSNMAFFLVYNKLCEINGVNQEYGILNQVADSLQADKQIIELLSQPIYEIDMENIPDLLPILMIYGALNKKGIKLTNVERIKYKECDRVAVMSENLKHLGISIVHSIDEDYVVVEPCSKIKGGFIKTYDDHRIAMSFAILNKFVNEDIYIDNKECVNKSFVNFWRFI